MADIKIREEKIQERRKVTPRKEFIKDIASWKTLVFYRNNGLISKFPGTDRVKSVMSAKNFEEYRDQLPNLGKEYDFNKTFFQNFQSLFKSIEMPNVIHFGLMENCDYADVVASSKNCYLTFRPINNCENIFYSDQVKDGSSNVFNSVMVRDQSENVYLSKGIIKSFNVFYSQYIYNSSNMRFCSDMVGCQECVECSGLENQSYCINNKQYSKEEYTEGKKELLKKKDEFMDHYLSLKGQGLTLGSNDVEGKHILMSDNVKNGNFVYQVRNGRNLVLVGGSELMEEIYDNISTGSGVSDNMYGIVGAGIGISHIYNCCHINNSSNIFYSYFLQSCSYCLGCVGLKNKQFCILNKEYSKEERYELADKIFAQMDKDGTLGAFFPGWLNPFYFNDTVAYLMDESFTKEEVTKEGFLRRDGAITTDIPDGAEVVKVKDLSKFQMSTFSGAREIDPAILKKVIKDDKGNCYRIVKMEYDFLMKHGLPLPEIHWLERIKLGFKFK